MSDREKVLIGLECCADPDTECGDCPYFNRTYFYPDCKESMMRSALELLKADMTYLKELEPRVMTLEEVKGMKRLTICAVEQRSKVIKNVFNAEYGDIVTIGNKNFLDFGLYGDTNRFRRAEAGYGKTWRCWSSRPTDEQREATPWKE